MKNYLCAFPLIAWTLMGLAFQEPGPPAAGTRTGSEVDLGGLKSRVPADWAQEPPDQARYYKQFRLEPVDDDKNQARVTINFLGKEKEEKAEDSVKRWKAMFLPPDGQTIQEAARVRKLKVNGAPTTFLDIHGDYKGTPGDDTSPRENYRLLGVYSNTPKGAYTIRLLGPNTTVEYYRKGFEDWVKAFK